MSKEPTAAKISPETHATLTAIVKRELDSIPGLRFAAKDVETIVRGLSKLRLWGGASEACLPRSFETTAIANKILDLHKTYESEKITLQDSFAFLLRRSQRFALRAKTLVKRIETDCVAWQVLGATRQQTVGFLITSATWNLLGKAKKGSLLSTLLLNGDLPAPLGSSTPRSPEKAVKIIFDNRTYSNLFYYSEEEIYAVALLTRLTDCSVSAAFLVTTPAGNVQLSNADRAAEIKKRLAFISDRKWESVKHLAEGAGFKRPVALRPDRFAAIREAQKRLADKKLHL